MENSNVSYTMHTRFVQWLILVYLLCNIKVNRRSGMRDEYLAILILNLC